MSDVIEILELENFISNEDCDYILSEIEPNLKKYKIKENDLNYNRMGITYRIHPTLHQVDTFIYDILRRVMEVLVQNKYYYSVFETKNEIQDSGYDFHRYHHNEGCDLHYDGTILLPHVTFAAISIGLNTPKTGGEIVFPNQNKKIKTEKGKVVVWPTHPFYKHEVLPPKDCHRDVLITWLIYSNYFVIPK